MIVFNNIDEIQQYYNENTNTFEFYENGEALDIKLNFNLRISSNLSVGYINALDIDAHNIKAHNINANDIFAWDINAHDISTRDINADNITANNINAHDIDFNAVCYAYKIFICNSIHGREENSKYFSLDNILIVKNKK